MFLVKTYILLIELFDNYQYTGSLLYLKERRAIYMTIVLISLLLLTLICSKYLLAMYFLAKTYKQQ